MQILENYDLSKLNTFGVSARARFFVEIKSIDEVKELFSLSLFKNHSKLFLGGGSNILFTKDFDGIVVLNSLKGTEIINEDNDTVLVHSMGGESWDDLVTFAVERNFWGIENLALVPGTVGASPMQNIGAYGVELKDTLVKVYCIDIDTENEVVFDNHECNFGYRDSIFKNEMKDRYFITAIDVLLSKKPNKNIEYKVLKNYIEEHNLKVETSKDVSNIVSTIRRSKLPDPKVLGNAGSFFKNVYVEETKFQELLLKYPEMPFFKEDDKIKIPTAWLIESCGFKGVRFGNVGIHDKQALILVNHGGATGLEVKNLAEQIISAVFKKFGITISMEVNLI
ncbi:MAG: UDP-N-acetylmuramate dehydrogenase [Candidatus Paceibacterota bacterium]